MVIKNPVIRYCANCGKRLELQPCRAKSNISYCDGKCMAEHRRNDPTFNPNWKGGLVEVICENCGKTFKCKINQVPNRKHCSRKCSAEAKSERALGYDPEQRVEKFCKVCRKSIMVKQSHVDHEGTYCSYECMAEDYKDRLTGEANPNWRGGIGDDPEYRKAWAAKWRRNNPEKVREQNRKTRARRKGAEGQYNPEDIDYLWRQQRGQCAYCSIDLSGGYHVDHIVPLCRGGTNYIGNIQLLCPTCNMRKGSKLSIEFKYQEGLFPVLVSR